MTNKCVKPGVQYKNWGHASAKKVTETGHTLARRHRLSQMNHNDQVNCGMGTMEQHDSIARRGAASNRAALPIRVGVIEDDPIVRAGFETAVRMDSRLSLLFSAANGMQGIELAQARTIDVLLIDLGLPDRDGRDVIRWFGAQQPEVQCVVVTVFGDAEHIVSSFEAGAVGYLLKDTPHDLLGEHVIQVFKGGSPISPGVARSMLRRFTGSLNGHHPAAADNPLSTRETEVLRLIEKGLTYVEAAQVLDVSWHTVTGYLRRVYRKLEVNSRSQAVFEARQRGIL